MNRFCRHIFIVLVLIVTSFDGLSQIATEYGYPVKWDRITELEKYIMKGVDTLTLDSILIDSNRYIRQKKDGQILEELSFSKNYYSFDCSDEGLKLSGYWTSYYKSGNIKEQGFIRCNHKFGDWVYFYESGRIMKYERYSGINIVDSNPNAGLLNGSYLEYHENGEVKISGTWRIVEKYMPFQIINPLTYEVKDSCCIWNPESVKWGNWHEYDEKGVLLNNVNHELFIKDSSNIREIADRYLQININEVHKN